MSKFNKKKLVRVDLYITPEQEIFLEKESNELFLSKSAIMRLAIKEYMEKQEQKTST